MYYINNKRPTKEYAIYRRVNNAVPYIATTFSNLRQVEEYLTSIERRHNHYNQTFYIDRVGYKNRYPKEFAQFYYKVLERPLSDWQEVA